MASSPVEQPTLSTTLMSQWEQLNEKIATLAAEFPEEKYELKPVTGVRTFGDVLRHLAFWNNYVAELARGKQADGTANELPVGDYGKKPRILAAFKKSAADALAALRTQPSSLPVNIAELYITFLQHSSEHYGQLATYCRLQEIVPPGSRP